MKRILFILSLLATFHISAQAEQTKYGVNASDPEWVHYMYEDNPSLFGVARSL